MQDARYPRFAAVITAIEHTGKSRAEIGRMAGRDGSATTRWAKGTHMPAWSGAKALADALKREHPGLADELLAAWHFYSDPAEAPAGSAIHPEVLRVLQKHYTPEQQAQAIELLEELSAAPADAPSAHDGPGAARAE